MLMPTPCKPLLSYTDGGPNASTHACRNHEHRVRITEYTYTREKRSSPICIPRASSNERITTYPTPSRPPKPPRIHPAPLPLLAKDLIHIPAVRPPRSGRLLLRLLRGPVPGADVEVRAEAVHEGRVVVVAAHEVGGQGPEELDLRAVVLRVVAVVVVIGERGVVKAGGVVGVLLLLLGELPVLERGHGLGGVGEGVVAGEHHGGEVGEGAVGGGEAGRHAEGGVLRRGGEGEAAAEGAVGGDEAGVVVGGGGGVDVVGASTRGFGEGAGVVVGERGAFPGHETGVLGERAGAGEVAGMLGGEFLRSGQVGIAVCGPVGACSGG